MSYQTGPALSPIDLLNQFVTFLAAAGWTVDDNALDGTGRAVHIHKGTSFIALRAFINENTTLLGGSAAGCGIAVLGFGAYSAGGAWYAQAGAPYLYGQLPGVNVTPAIMPLPAGAISNYWMFADAAGTNVVLVANKAPGIYTHLYFGQINKYNTWTGGAYFGASRQYIGAFTAGTGITVSSAPPGAMGYSNGSGTMFRADVDSWVNRWLDLTSAQNPGSIQTVGKRAQSSTRAADQASVVPNDHINFGALAFRAKSSNTSGLILLPTILLVERDFGGQLYGGGWSAIGEIPYVYQSTTDGFVPGSTHTIGTDQYLVFPNFAIRKFP